MIRTIKSCLKTFEGILIRSNVEMSARTSSFLKSFIEGFVEYSNIMILHIFNNRRSI